MADQTPAAPMADESPAADTVPIPRWFRVLNGLFILFQVASILGAFAMLFYLHFSETHCTKPKLQVLLVTIMFYGFGNIPAVIPPLLRVLYREHRRDAQAQSIAAIIGAIIGGLFVLVLTFVVGIGFIKPHTSCLKG
jgi:hypothetical protein